MLARTISTLTTKLTLLVGTSLALVAGGVVTFVAKTTTLSAPPKLQTRIKLRTNHRTIRFSDAVALAAPTLESSSARPSTLAAADFDEDGMPDLLSGAVNTGVGVLSLYRGNAEAIYPTQRTATPALPFFPATQFFNLPVAPDFLVTGDFNADGHSDVVTAARNDSALYLLAGDGKGGLAEAVAMELSGEVTALAAGEINRVDGLPDLAVALNARAGASVTVLTAADGAWNAQPQSFALAQAATAMEFAHLTRDGWSDLALTAGNELVVLEGGSQTPRLTRTRLTFVADSLAVGRFTDSTQEQIALLARDGSLAVASIDRAIERRSRGHVNSGWQVASYVSEATAQAEQTSPRQLLRARVSASQHDDLLTLQGNQLQFVTNSDATQRAATTLDGEADLVAALPLRTNASALQGLVLLSRTQATPFVVQPEVAMTFVVNSTGDGGDSNPGDGVCATISTAGPPICTLRAAIQEANANVGADTINFNISPGTQTISLLGLALPPITEAVTINATPPAPSPDPQVIVISPGGNFFDTNFALTIASSGNTIRDLTIAGFAATGALRINAGTGNVIEGNTLRNNFGSGLQINSSNNVIGGTTAAARNVIAANSATGLGINSASGNQILGNYIGTDSTGTLAIGNDNGIALFLASNNTIGGTAAGARNVISGNRFGGILVRGGMGTPADGNIIQGNYIGVDATGTGALGNAVAAGVAPDSGIRIIEANLTTIGGATPTASNIIANNGADGVTIETPSSTSGTTANRNQVLYNSIYNNNRLGIDLGATGVTANDPGDGDTGANNLQNYPILTSALTRATGTTITGTLNSTANSIFTIELFNNAACDPTGNGEGETYLTRTTVTTNAAGLANFTVVTPTPILAGRSITATATDANGNTSEFSACRAVQNAMADLVVTQTATPNPIFVGNNLTYNLTVTNAGPDDATGVTLTNAISIPNGQFTVVSLTPSQGTCTGTGPINCSLGTINSTANATVSIVLAPTIVTAGTPPNSVTATNIATVVSNEQDPVTANNTNAAGATVNASANVAITQTATPSPVPSGSVVTYTITITNNGPSTANGVSAVFTPSLLLTNVMCAAPPGASCNRDGNPFFASTPSLAPGATAMFTLTGRLTCLGQTATITNGVTVSSSTFDANLGNNTSSVSLTGQSGSAVGIITYRLGGNTLSLGPVVAGSTAAPPSGTFALMNTGCLPMNLTTALFRRAGNTTNLTGLDDSRYFSLWLVPATGAEIPLNPTPNPDRNAPQPIPINRTLQSGETLSFRVAFNPPLPFFAGFFASRDQLLFANQVLPDSFASSVVFNFITGGATPTLEAAGDPGSVTASLTARISPAIQIIPRDGNAVGGSTTPLVIMETLRGDFRVRVSMYDANRNPTRITYQFFDTFRQPASNPIPVDLTSLLSTSPILPGQCFSLQQDFSGAAGRPDIVYVRVTVNDGDGTTVAATSSPFLPALAAPTALRAFTTATANSDVITLPPLRIDGSAATRQRQTGSRSSGGQ